MSKTAKTKHCKSCNSDLELSHFHQDNSQRDNLYPICKNCRKQSRYRFSNFGVTDNDLIGFIKAYNKTKISFFDSKKDAEYTSKPRRLSKAEIAEYERQLDGDKLKKMMNT